MKNILVLTDFSAVASNAAQYAVRLAESLKANIILFNAYVPQESLVASAIETAGDETDEQINGQSEIKLEVLVKKLRMGLSNTKKPLVSAVSKEGMVKDCIQQLIKEKEVDLIVMGAHQYNDLTSLLYGNNVNGVIEKASCPVLLIPEQAVFKSVKNIFYATDLRYCDVKITRLLKAFAEPFKAGISLFHVCAGGLPELSDSEALSIFSDTISPGVKYPPLTYSSTKSRDAELVINQIIEKNDMDILAIAHRQNHFFKRIFQSSITKKNDAYLHIPLLVLPVI